MDRKLAYMGNNLHGGSGYARYQPNCELQLEEKMRELKEINQQLNLPKIRTPQNSISASLDNLSKPLLNRLEKLQSKHHQVASEAYLQD